MFSVSNKMYMFCTKFQCNGIISAAVIAENKCKDIIKSLQILGDLLSVQLHPSTSFFPIYQTPSYGWAYSLRTPVSRNCECHA